MRGLKKKISKENFPNLQKKFPRLINEKRVLRSKKECWEVLKFSKSTLT